ncbi:zinc ribbon domain-containing protein [Collinsella bouchesdurhonensis]|uniref:zinc ribbon domain-containing protein n=1 Tax=Collinsella bouchesdurhonensis TaxID=1907654 RepID=UPI0034A0F7D3
MTEEELNVQVQAAQDEIARLRETFGPAYAKLGEALYPAARETELATRFANEFAEVDAINAAIDEQNAAIEAACAEYETEQARIVEEEAARAAEEAARAQAEATAAAKAAAVEEPLESADEPEPAPAKVRTCPKCGTTLQPTDKFCAGCGSKVADLFAPAAPHCPNCGKEVDESMNFCIYCGTSLK